MCYFQANFPKLNLKADCFFKIVYVENKADDGLK